MSSIAVTTVPPFGVVFFYCLATIVVIWGWGTTVAVTLYELILLEQPECTIESDSADRSNAVMVSFNEAGIGILTVIATTLERKIQAKFMYKAFPSGAITSTQPNSQNITNFCKYIS